MSDRKRPAGERGVVTVETALVVGTILTLLLFSLQVGILGFLQLTTDAAAFVNARETALQITPATTTIFPQISQSNITLTTQPAPQPSVPTDFGYNSTNSVEQAQSAFNRHGGASMMEPELSKTAIAKPGIFSRAGTLFGVAGSATESYWQECGIHSNIANSPLACGDSTAPSTFAGNYFTKGENTPPYYASFNYIQHCESYQPWSTCGTNLDFIALGVGEYLTDSNWGANANGVSGASGTSAFQATACHQRVYAGIANFLSYYPTLGTIYALYAYAGSVATPNGIAHVGGVVCQLYAYCNYGGASADFNDFGDWTAFDPTTNAQIQQIYSWDRTVQAGYAPAGYTRPNQYPLYPENGC